MLVSAYLLATTGSGLILTPVCVDPPSGPSPASYFAAAWRAAIAVGLVAVALRDLSGPRLSDPTLLGLLLAFAGLSLLSGAANGLVDGVVRLGANRCIEISPPWAYAYSAFVFLAGTVALVAAVSLLAGRGRSDE
jgi:hypothetical protein